MGACVFAACGLVLPLIAAVPDISSAADGIVSLPQDRIFEGGPGLEWEMDVAWVIRGGADPLAWIETYKDRITAALVKDIAPAGQNADEDGWADVGHGTVDWKGLVAALKSTRVKHFVVEHDNPKDIDRLITRSIASFNTY